MRPRRKREALELLAMLKRGPASLKSNPFDKVPEAERKKMAEAYHLWCDTWIIPKVKFLVRELRPDGET